MSTAQFLHRVRNILALHGTLPTGLEFVLASPFWLAWEETITDGAISATRHELGVDDENGLLCRNHIRGDSDWHAASVCCDRGFRQSGIGES